MVNTEQSIPLRIDSAVLPMKNPPIITSETTVRGWLASEFSNTLYLQVTHTSEHNMQVKFDRFLEKFKAAWHADRFSDVLNLWDPDEAEPWHFPEELNQPLVGREAITEYLKMAGQAITAFSVVIDNSHIKHLAEGCYAFRFEMCWQATMSSQTLHPKPIGTRVRVSGVLRDTEDGLKLAHYMEAGPAALPYMLAQYEQFAADQFGPAD